MAAASCAAREARNGVGACRSLVHDDKRERLCKAPCVIKGICKAPHTAHLPAVATGAFVSPLRYFKNTGMGSGSRPFCHDALGSAQHVFWECYRVTNVEQLRPHGDLEAVFGWPVSQDDDRCLKHMVAVRCQILALRYPGGGAPQGLLESGRVSQSS